MFPTHMRNGASTSVQNNVNLPMAKRWWNGARAVELFFFMTGTVTAAQNVLLDNMRRIFNGALEDCLI